MKNLDCRDNDCMVSWESVSEHKKEEIPEGMGPVGYERREEEEEEVSD